MRYLLAVWDGGGATPPNLGIARLLVDRGHEVVVYGDPTLADAIAATGAEHRIWPTAPQRMSTALDDDVLKDWECRTQLAALTRVRDRLMTGPAARFAADVAAALDAEPFDAVLADGLLLGALVGAEARGIPTAALVGSVYLQPSRTRPPFGLGLAPAHNALGRARDRAAYALMTAAAGAGMGPVNAARAEHGLAPVRNPREQWDRADRVLVLTGSAFDDPPPDAPNTRYVGPVLEDIPAEGSIELPPGDAPLVVVGLSSSYMKQADLLNRISRALASLPVRAVITTGPAIDPDEIPTSKNVVVVQSASHAELIPKAALVITHAGHGTLIKALTAGVPALCIPLGRDQPENAARAARHGVAGVLPKGADADAIATAVLDMLLEPSYRDAAVDLGGRIRAEIASGVLASELEALPGLRRRAS
ncbi:MGT family glycosyltransferase [Agromyces terreus]|uniref:MGT family glycosyltransferase n=1 Tax=Agromyces terreus TaxID=424795 RepID=A0A9X2H182_9MICO|nr:glycosyltransferase [Agromyces terreus]MCP2372442.1 MGT family glycosyltransferase [Agromyces terreus]